MENFLQTSDFPYLYRLTFSGCGNYPQSIDPIRIFCHFPAMKTKSRRFLKVTSLAATLAATSALAPYASHAAQLSTQTAHAFDRYIAAKEARDNRELAPPNHFLYIDAFPQAQRSQSYAELKAGEVLVQRGECNTPACTKVSGGLIHDWVGVAFVRGVSLSQALVILQDYNRDAALYPAEVVKSRLLSHSGSDFQVYLRLKQVHVITVVLDSDYGIHYSHLDSTHALAVSHSTRIAEVNHADTAAERGESVGNDHGFLWRLDSYWRFWEADGGLYIQIEAISLTRDVPTGLGWLIGSFIESIPKSSLRSTLDETRSALLRPVNLQEENSK